MTGAAPPAPAVLAAFGVPDAALTLLPGGRGTSWRARGGDRDLVLKPVGGPQEATEIAWWADLRATLPVTSKRLRMTDPARAADRAWVVDGWRADHRLPGSARPDRCREILEVAAAFHEALADVPRPAFLDLRNDRWAVADRAAWDESERPLHPAIEPVERRLRRLVRPAVDPPQLLHGDLIGNVLFASGLPPAVIDLSLYWRPAVHGAAVVVADALLSGHAGTALLVEAGRAGEPPAVARAVLFRLLDLNEQVLALAGRPDADVAPYARVTGLLERAAAPLPQPPAVAGLDSTGLFSSTRK